MFQNIISSQWYLGYMICIYSGEYLVKAISAAVLSHVWSSELSSDLKIVLSSFRPILTQPTSSSLSSRYYRGFSIIIAHILCTTKSPKHLCQIKLPITSRDIPSHFSQYWAMGWQAYCSPDNCPTSSASEDNWQLSDNTMKEVDATPCQPLQRSTAPSNSMPYHIAIGEVRIRRQKNHLGWM